MQPLAYIDGKVVPASEAKVSVMDRGFLFGDGVYEAGRSYDRCFLYLEEHWQRLRFSASKLSLAVPWSDQKLTEGLFELARAYGKQDMCFRTIITRGIVESVGIHLMEGSSQTLVHIVQDVPAHFEVQRKEGVKVLTSKIVRNLVSAQDPNIKTSNYLNSLLASQDVQRRGAVDGILCDYNGKVTEGINFSIFGVTKDNVILTPSLDVGILDSITRRHVLELARREFKAEEGIYSLENFQSCREIFIVSSTREIVPVSQWDKKTYPIPGEITESLQKRLKQEIAQYLSTHPKF